MQYDLDLVLELCGEVGLASKRSSADSLQIDLGCGALLTFGNWPDDNDCWLGFQDTDWHSHGELLLATRDHRDRCFDQMDIVAGLADGKLLVCEQWKNGTIVDRELVLPDYDVSEELGFNPQIEIRVRRAFVAKF